jgi:hypothetical protein
MEALEALAIVPAADTRPVIVYYRLETLKARFLDGLEALDRALDDPAMENM